MVTKKKKVQDMSENEKNLTPVYARAAMQSPVPKYELPDGELDPETTYNLIHDELMLDGTRGSIWPRSSPPGWSHKPKSSWRKRSTKYDRQGRVPLHGHDRRTLYQHRVEVI